MKKLEDYPTILTPSNVCDILQISKSSFYKRVWQGTIPITKIGGSVRVDKRKLEKMLEDNSRSIN